MYDAEFDIIEENAVANILDILGVPSHNCRNHKVFTEWNEILCSVCGNLIGVWSSPEN